MSIKLGLPDGWVPERTADLVQLTDGTAAIIVRAVPGVDSKGVEEMLRGFLLVMAGGMTVAGPTRNGRVPLMRVRIFCDGR